EKSQMPGTKVLFLCALTASPAAFFLASATAATPEEPMLLVAKRSFEDPVYGSTIVLARPVQGGGHVGFIVNKPTKLNLAELDRGLWFVDEPEAKLVLRRKTDGLWEELVRRLEAREHTI